MVLQINTPAPDFTLPSQLGTQVTLSQFRGRNVVLAAPDVVDAMLDQESTSVAQLEDFIGIPIKFQAEALYPREQYDVVLM